MLWYNQFKSSGYKGFKEDERGAFKRDSFLETHNLVLDFVRYMKTATKLSVKSYILKSLLKVMIL
jgi:hypothetical protein